MKCATPVGTFARIVAVAALACTHPVSAPAAPIAASDSYCWWTLVRTALPPDTVARRFERAYQTLGLDSATFTHRADTAWAHAGPTVLRDVQTSASYASFAAAVRQGDSTSFRYSVEIKSLSRTDGPPPDGIAFCGRIAKAAGIPWVKPERRPNSEDSLSAFMRAP